MDKVKNYTTAEDKQNMNQRRRTLRKAASTRCSTCSAESECLTNHNKTCASASVVSLKNEVIDYKNKHSNGSGVENFGRAGFSNDIDTKKHSDEGLELAKRSFKKSLKCEFCIKNFTKRKYLSRHMKSHMIKNEYGAQTNESVIENGNKLESKTETERKTRDNKEGESYESTDKPHKCQYCTKSFARRNCLSRHIRTHTGERPYECSVCERRFVEHGAMRVHYRIHTGERPFICVHCGRSFRHKSNLTLHERRHFNDKRYKCSLCPKTFISPGNCKKHERSHSKEKIYQCEDCFLRFKTGKGLTNHAITHEDSIHKCHVCLKDSNDQKEHMIKCGLCEKTFTKSSSLKIHYRTHTGEKPYKCETCSRSYARLATLIQHLNVHTGDKLYKCNECNKNFTRQFTLALHQRTHTGTKPYHCRMCNKGFTQISNLNRHLSMHNANFRG